MQINQTEENTYNLKISIVNKGYYQISEIEDMNNEIQHYRKILANDFNIGSEISMSLMPEEIYLIKKFLDVN